jgi:hypothetical protein
MRTLEILSFCHSQRFERREWQPTKDLDRAPLTGYEQKGRTFESCRAHNQINRLRRVKYLPFFICDNLVPVVLRVSGRHSRDGVALAGIARIHIAHRGRDRGVTIFHSWFSSY